MTNLKENKTVKTYLENVMNDRIIPTVNAIIERNKEENKDLNDRVSWLKTQLFLASVDRVSHLEVVISGYEIIKDFGNEEEVKSVLTLNA